MFLISMYTKKDMYIARAVLWSDGMGKFQFMELHGNVMRLQIFYYVEGVHKSYR